MFAWRAVGVFERKILIFTKKKEKPQKKICWLNNSADWFGWISATDALDEYYSGVSHWSVPIDEHSGGFTTCRHFLLDLLYFSARQAPREWAQASCWNNLLPLKTKLEEKNAKEASNLLAILLIRAAGERSETEEKSKTGDFLFCLFHSWASVCNCTHWVPTGYCH